MKTNLGLLFILFTTLISCTQEEFYDKDFLETLSDKEKEEVQDDDKCSTQCEDEPNTNTGSTLTTIEEQFVQSQSNNKIDILWVVDNSGSMGAEQALLAQNFDSFIQDFVTKNIDFKMAITTTDAGGVPVTGSLSKLTKTAMDQDTNQFMNDFKNLIKVGIYGSGHEKGMHNSDLFTLNYAPTYFRSDAYYIVVYVSDEWDQSSKTVEEYYANLTAWKSDTSKVKAYSIVNMKSNYQYGHARYKKITELTNGTINSIHSDFYQTLTSMGTNIANLVHSFVLTNNITLTESIKVYIDNVLVTSGWSYDSVNNAILFEASSVPGSGAQIKVEYQIES
ncbi:MAG: hypothetical protein N4A33_05465 [Bacteriovoracaceae bacterium]|jgi:hypothetical protein|nr:hypothetical protein [Bacteriovoracaceae bacterium]